MLIKRLIVPRLFLLLSFIIILLFVMGNIRKSTKRNTLLLLYSLLFLVGYALSSTKQQENHVELSRAMLPSVSYTHWIREKSNKHLLALTFLPFNCHVGGYVD